MNILNAIGAGIVAVGLFIGSLFGYTPDVQAPIETPSEELGVALPSGTANFESALATGITNTATTMTLASISIRGGGSLSGYQCFTIDEGSAQSEFVCGTASSTSSGLFTGLERGLSPADGVTETTALKFSHRRGASVKITDFPLIQRLKSQASGSGTYEGVLQYATSVSTSTVGSNGQNLANVAYVNALSFGGVAASASSSVAGFVELATGGEAASTTIFGTTGAMLALHTGISTSSAPASGNVVVVTGDDGNIDTGFLPYGAGASSTVRTYTSTTTTHTWTKPSNLLFIRVQLWGAGGSGGASGSAGHEEAGGGGGGYFERTFASSQLVSSSYEVVVGTGGASVSGSGNGNDGTASTFGSTLAIAYGGGGGGGNNSTGASGGGGGGAYATGTRAAGATAGVKSDITASDGGNLGTAITTAFSGSGGGGCADSGGGCASGGNTVWGGAGGGGAYTGGVGGGGTSRYGGNGGTGSNTVSATAGSQPAGGGGGGFGVASGAGGAGQVIITEYF